MENFENSPSHESLSAQVIELQKRMNAIGKFESNDEREILEEAVLLFEDQVDAHGDPIDIEAVVNKYIDKMFEAGEEADKRAE